MLLDKMLKDTIRAELWIPGSICRFTFLVCIIVFPLRDHWTSITLRETSKPVPLTCTATL